MPDLRTLSLEARQSLAAEVERRARAGEAPKDIRAALGLTVRSYSTWAKLFGFRQCDLFPDKPRAGAPQKLAPGPGGYARQVLELARAAIEAGDQAEADRLVAGWRSKVRRDKAMADLERAAADETRAAGEGSEPTLSDAELAAEVSAMLGLAVRISGPS